MKTLKLLLFLLIGLTCLNSFGQVSGKAFLYDQTDHSGIKITFFPSSPTAVLDSTNTNTDGNYSININPGIYNISYSKIGYQDMVYNNGNLIILAGNETLNDVTLYEGIIEHIIGDISGTLFDSIIYLIDGDINIPIGDSLIIEPGTELKFSGNYNMNVNGQLIAIGTVNSPILFSSYQINPQPGDWGFINFLNSSITSDLSYSIVEYGRIYCDHSDPNITNNIVRNFNARGIEAYNSSPNISNNKIYNFYNDMQSGTGIIAQFSSSVIECNQIFNGSGRGIVLWGGYAEAKNNEIYNINISPGAGIGMMGGGPNSDDQFYNNIIYNCKSGIIIDDWWSEASKPEPTIINNTIYDNNLGIGFSGSDHGSGVIKMNIIANNITGISGGMRNQPSEISYNILWGNSSADYSNIDITGIGQIITININGDSVDSYYNLYQDPLFDTNDMPNLLGNSPAINAGDPSYFDPDETIRDIGVDISLFDCSDSTISIIPKLDIGFPSLRLYPSPTNNLVNIDLNDEYENISVSIHGINGEILLYKEFFRQKVLKLNIESFSNGMYFIQLKSGNMISTLKMVKIK